MEETNLAEAQVRANPTFTELLSHGSFGQRQAVVFSYTYTTSQSYIANLKGSFY